MTKWTMVKPRSGMVFKGRKPRTTPAVRKTKASFPVLVVPDGFTEFSTANVYTGDDGRVAVHFCDDGKFKLSKSKTGAKLRNLTLPRSIAGQIPSGTTDATLTRDGDKYVLDPSQFSSIRIAAE